MSSIINGRIILAGCLQAACTCRINLSSKHLCRLYDLLILGDIFAGYMPENYKQGTWLPVVLTIVPNITGS